MPFRLTNGPATFTRLMNLALSELTSTHCLAYLDDIIIWAPSFEEHLHRLRLLFDRIRTAALKLKPTQCQFLKREVSFPGHVVSSDGIKIDPDKVETVKTLPTPVRHQRAPKLHCSCNYYKWFISGFSIVAEPLYELSRKGVFFQWQMPYPDFSPHADYSYLTQMQANPWALALFYLDCNPMTLSV